MLEHYKMLQHSHCQVQQNLVSLVHEEVTPTDGHGSDALLQRLCFCTGRRK